MKCKHNIEENKACPWCNRPASNTFPVTHPQQLYQIIFDQFMNNISHEAQGPLPMVIIARDINGKTYHYTRGPESDVVPMISTYIDEMIKEKEASTCSEKKLENGFKKLFDSIKI